MANQQTLDILLRIKAENDKALKQFSKDTLDAGKAAQRMADDATKAMLKTQAEALRMNAAFDRTAKQGMNAMQAEARRMNAELDKAAKQAMVAAQTEAKKMNTEFDKAAKEAAKLGQGMSNIGAKAFEFNQITQAAGTVWRALGAIVDVAVAVGREFVELAQRGAQVSNVAGSFEKLALSVNATGDAMLGKAREGTKGLVADYDLMLAANRGILLGLPITANEMGVLGAAATSLGKSLGVDATQALNDLITGLGRGSAAILDNLAITVNAEEEQKKYAEAHGKTVEQLTAAEKKLAIYNAAITAAKATMAQLGETQLTTADRLKQLQVGWQNFTDMMALAIARSPVLNAGLGALADAVQKAFGANQAQTINLLIGWVNEFAIFVGKAAMAGVAGARAINDGWNLLKIAFSGITAGMALDLKLMVDGMKLWIAALAGLPGVIGAPFRAAKDALTDASSALGKFGKDSLVAASETKKSWDESDKKLLGVFGAIGHVVDGMERARGTIIAVASAAGTIPPAVEAAGKAIAMDAEKRAEALRLIAKASAESIAKFWDDEEKKALGTLKVIEDGSEATYAAKAKRAEEARDVILKAQEDEIKAAEEAAKKYVEHWNDFAEAVNGARDILEMLGVTGESAFGQIAGAAAQTADMLAQAAQQGYISWQQLGTQIVSTFKNGSAAGGAMSGAMTGFAIGGPIGAGIGAIGGAILGWFGGAKKAREEMQKLRNEFIQSAGGMVALKQRADEAGVSLDNMFKAKSAAQLQAAIAKIKGQLDTWKDSHDKLNAAVEKYGFTLEELGPKFQAQQLDEMAQTLLQDWSLLVAGGIDVANVATRMADSLNELAAKARVTGQALPESMRPIYEELLSQKKLVDENGNAYGSLEEAGLTFTASLTDSMKELVEEIKRMVAAITGVRIPPIRVPVVYDDPGYNGGGGGGGGHHANPNEDPGFAEGGVGNFGAGTPAMLHGHEAILPLDDNTLGRLAAMIGRHGGGGGGRGPIVVNVGGRQVYSELSNASRRGQFRVHPNALQGGF